jgi:uncharacterized protein
MKLTSKEKGMAILAALATISIIISMLLLVQGLDTKEPGAITSDTMPLLAVSTGDGAGLRGGIAYLDLKIINGTGAVYVHAEPFTRVDTQATTRFAKQYACSISDVDCSQYDFLYSISSDAPIVGGPSAGAAMTALTITLLEGKAFPQGVSITGSISSGGIIGNVGGIDQKIEAARRAGLRTVVIPALSNYTNDGTAGIRVVMASTVEEALTAIDDSYSFNRTDSIEVPSAYTETMRDVASSLCNDNQAQYEEIRGMTLPDTRRINTSLEMIGDLIDESANAEAQGLHYTQASHCFNARTRLHYLRLTSQITELEDESLTSSVLMDIMDIAQSRAESEYSTFVSSSRNDINSIQIKSIVQERYDESMSNMDEIRDGLRANTPFSPPIDDTLFDLGYALARIDSMISWISFAGYDQDSPQASQAAMRLLCNRKISEANERAEYVEYATGMRTIDLTDAHAAVTRRNFDDCIYKASLVKARADMIMSRIGTPSERIPELVMAKRSAAEHAIAQQSYSGIFPVMAYSYLEYANSLEDDNPEVALLYYENAIELSGLSSYLAEGAEGTGFVNPRSMNRTYLFLLFLGLSLGFSMSMIIIGLLRDRQQKRIIQEKQRPIVRKPKTSPKRAPAKKVNLKKISR